MKLQISNSLKQVLPSFSISAYTFSLIESNDENHLSNELTKAFEELTEEYNQLYTLENVVKIEKIKYTRDGYKKLGKDPSHTRAACEALLRRILKYQSIYRLGDVIDLGNYLSLKLLKSVCVVDLDKICGDIEIRIGNENDEYYGINRGQINVNRIPLYTDELGPFGNPTSDTLRTAITNSTKNVLIMLIHFDEESIISDELITEETINKYLKINELKKINI